MVKALHGEPFWTNCPRTCSTWMTKKCWQWQEKKSLLSLILTTEKKICVYTHIILCVCVCVLFYFKHKLKEEIVIGNFACPTKDFPRGCLVFITLLVSITCLFLPYMTVIHPFAYLMSAAKPFNFLCVIVFLSLFNNAVCTGYSFLFPPQFKDMTALPFLSGKSGLTFSLF